MTSAFSTYSDWHLMACGVPNAPTPFTVNLRGRDVLVVEQVLDLFDRHAGIVEILSDHPDLLIFVRAHRPVDAGQYACMSSGSLRAGNGSHEGFLGMT